MNIEKILLITFALINVAGLVSRSVLTKVGKNNGKDCPDISGPIIACVIYGITLLSLIGLTVKARIDGQLNNNIHLGLLGLMIILVIAVLISYIPFIIAIKNKSSTDTECLREDNLKAIQYLELFINGTLVLLSVIVFFM
jgi:hypothetical protein